MSIEWRLLRSSDVPGAFELSRIAGWNQTEADWLSYLSLDAEGCMAALIGGELAGTVTSMRYGERLGWIGMLLVHPRHRGRGLGKELILRSIRQLRAKGVRLIKLDATPMGRNVYLPLGFRDEFEVRRMEGCATEVPVEEETASSVGAAKQMIRSDLFDIAELDSQAFGADRRALLVASSSREPELCFVVRDCTRITGYLIAREGREAIQLGPIVALSPVAAERLIQALFRAAQGRRLFLDLPTPNQAGGDILARYGFKAQRSFIRMILGDDLQTDNVGLVYGTGGAENG